MRKMYDTHIDPLTRERERKREREREREKEREGEWEIGRKKEIYM